MEKNIQIEAFTKALTEENKKLYELVLKAHLKTENFVKHPRLAKPFAEKLAQLFQEAQGRGDVIEVNRYDLGAPNCSPVQISVKDSNREKEK